MSVEIKICGLVSEADVLSAVAAGCDICGFVHCRASPRHVGRADLVRLVRIAGECGVVAALVVSDEEEDKLCALVMEAKPDIIQCHGHETPDRLRRLRSLCKDCQIWKALPVTGVADIRAASRFDGVADRLLLDAPPMPNSSRTGGFGRVFDWSVLREAAPSMRWVLAGGLDPDNVAGAILASGAVAVDASSGVESDHALSGGESALGRKDAEKMRAFVENAKNAHV